MTGNNAVDVDDLVVDFVLESRESLERFEHDTVGLEKDPGSRELANSAFRALHTIKGTGAYFGFARLETVVHLGESVLMVVRDGKATFDAVTASALLGLADVVGVLLDGIAETGEEPQVDTSAVEGDLQHCLSATAVAEAPRQRFGETLIAAGAVSPAEVAWAVALQASGDPRPIGAILLEAGLVDESQIDSVLTLQGRDGQDASVRVGVDVLDELVQLVGELARVRAEVGPRLPAEAEARLGGVAAALRAAVLRTRLEPVERAWSTLPRLVRDLSAESGKQVRLLTEGRGLPMDRALLAAVKSPLTHLVRNAVDHGIEGPLERDAAGKPVQATLRVRAYADGDELVLEVGDDGRGIDVDRVAQTALARGVVSPERLAAMTVEEMQALVFEPGFSTASAVTTVSGRGVGMDVVKTDIEQVGGRVEILSSPGLGCTMRLRLPQASAMAGA